MPVRANPSALQRRQVKLAIAIFLGVSLPLTGFLVWLGVTGVCRTRSHAELGGVTGSDATGASALNGFDLSTCLVPRESLMVGAEARDLIPALDHPLVIAGQEWEALSQEMRQKRHRKFLVRHERVIGVVCGGEARAYQLSVLNYHEVVNDTVGGEPVLVTYCPLTDSAVVFSRQTTRGELSFGVSGLLANSNLLLYDREAGPAASLWSQLQARAVSGPAAQAGATLEILPSELVSWEDWLARHPDTTVLSHDTGFDRNYGSNPYSVYFDLGRPRFPLVPEFDPAGPEPMARLIALERAGTWQVYLLDALQTAQEQAGPVERDGLRFYLTPWQPGMIPPTVRAVVIGQEATPLPAITSFWFAWQVLRPERP